MQTIKSFCDEVCASQSIELFPAHEDMLRQFYGGNYRELVAILGRRSGKNFLGALIATYQILKLLSLEDPYQYYHMASGNPLYIMVICSSSDQARIMNVDLRDIICRHKELSHRLDKSKKKSDPEHLWFATAGGHPVVLGTYSCKSDSLLGKRIYSLIMNDVRGEEARYGYSALVPATADFINPETDKLDSRVVTISGPSEHAHSRYQFALENDNSLVFKYATWQVNPNLTERKIRQEFKCMSDEDIALEFGAEFPTDMKNETISMRLSGATVGTLKRLAREIAFKEDKDYSYVDLIRSAIAREIDQRMEITQV